jgi:hypothetical protein
MVVKGDGKLPKDIFAEISKGNYNEKLV